MKYERDQNPSLESRSLSHYKDSQKKEMVIKVKPPKKMIGKVVMVGQPFQISNLGEVVIEVKEVISLQILCNIVLR